MTFPVEKMIFTSSRELRMVPANWTHPTRLKKTGRYFIHPDTCTTEYVPLFDGYKEAVRTWDLRNAKWKQGLDSDLDLAASDHVQCIYRWVPKCEEALKYVTLAEWDGERPDPKDYMPDWPDSERTHFMWYETVTEGTPISPVLPSKEALVRWLYQQGDDDYDTLMAMVEASIYQKSRPRHVYPE